MHLLPEKRRVAWVNFERGHAKPALTVSSLPHKTIAHVSQTTTNTGDLIKLNPMRIEENLEKQL